MADHSTVSKLSMLGRYDNGDYRPLNSQNYEHLRREFRKDVTENIIVNIPYKDRFFTDIVREMLWVAMTNGKRKKAIQDAFELLELYCLNLIHYYWKPEISIVKVGIHSSTYLSSICKISVAKWPNFLDGTGLE